MYRTILADPPWPEIGGGKIKRGADKHYAVMKIPDILKTMQDALKDKVDVNAHMYLWVTNNYLPSGLYVMESLGFRYVTTITWMKDRQGLGQYYRGMTEHCLFGVKGVLPYKVIDGKRAQGKTGFYAPKREHSQKPDELIEMVERVSYPPRLELFARNRRDGWDSWGNEIS